MRLTHHFMKFLIRGERMMDPIKQKDLFEFWRRYTSIRTEDDVWGLLNWVNEIFTETLLNSVNEPPTIEEIVCRNPFEHQPVYRNYRFPIKEMLAQIYLRYPTIVEAFAEGDVFIQQEVTNIKNTDEQELKEFKDELFPYGQSFMILIDD